MGFRAFCASPRETMPLPCENLAFCFHMPAPCAGLRREEARGPLPAPTRALAQSPRGAELTLYLLLTLQGPVEDIRVCTGPPSTSCLGSFLSPLFLFTSLLITHPSPKSLRASAPLWFPLPLPFSANSASPRETKPFPSLFTLHNSLFISHQYHNREGNAEWKNIRISHNVFRGWFPYSQIGQTSDQFHFLL